MSNYVPWHGKKQETLTRREGELIRVLQRGGSDEETTRAAEEVRVSKVRALRAERMVKAERFWRRPSDGALATRLARIDEMIRYYQAISVVEMIMEYRGMLSSDRKPSGE
ncbi:MAG: hypothetical protein ABI353_10535 [Isosphaeraceae bacterium]